MTQFAVYGLCVRVCNLASKLNHLHRLIFVPMQPNSAKHHQNVYEMSFLTCYHHPEYEWLCELRIHSVWLSQLCQRLDCWMVFNFLRRIFSMRMTILWQPLKQWLPLSKLSATNAQITVAHHLGWGCWQF